jgi:hypothetical protein
MEQTPAQSALNTAAATLRMIWAAMFARFGMFGVEPVRQGATANWCAAIFRRIDALLARYQAGTLRSLAAARVVQPGRKIVNQPALRMPRKWAWLVITGKHHAVVYGLQLQQVLAQPDMAELLEVSAQARRILRPLCRALAVDLPWVADKVAAERGVTRRRTRKPRAKPEPFRIPLPRGVLTAARRQGFGKMC